MALPPLSIGLSLYSFVHCSRPMPSPPFGIRGQGVGEGGAPQLVNRDKGVASGITCVGCRIGQMDAWPGSGVGVGGDIQACAAVDNVGAGTADQDVVAPPTVQRVDGGVTEQDVVERGAVRVLELRQLVACSVSTGRRATKNKLDRSQRPAVVGPCPHHRSACRHPCLPGSSRCRPRRRACCYRCRPSVCRHDRCR